MTTPQVAEIADKVMAEIQADIDAGTVPASVSSFAELHDYVDANMYADADLPLNDDEDDDSDIDLINAVQNEVDRRLASR